MDITPIIPKTKNVITGYGEGGFKINGEWKKGSLIIFGEQALEWNVTDAAQMTAEHFAPILNSDPSIELLLIGTGKNMVPLEPALRQHFRSRNIAVDTMDTGAACRTYNVLLSEERRVAVAVITI